MTTLHIDFETRSTVDLKTAGELANISGKFLKAEQLEFAKEVFRGRQVRPAILINPDA